MPYLFEASFEVTRNDGVLFSVMRNHLSSTGGMHTDINIMAENFVLETGAILTLEDLFSVPYDQYMPRIEQAVLQAADALYGEDIDEVLYGDFETRLMEVFEPTSFCLTETGVIFFWQVYNLGPYTAGPQTFEISYDAIKDIIDGKWMI